MDFTENKVSSRKGPLIAVIKIQLAADHTDRIFLHQQDDDMLLAEQFVHKHNLKPILIEHIFRKIRMSRAALTEQQNGNDQLLFTKSLNKINPQHISHFQPTYHREIQRQNHNDVKEHPFTNSDGQNSKIESSSQEYQNGSRGQDQFFHGSQHPNQKKSQYVGANTFSGHSRLSPYNSNNQKTNYPNYQSGDTLNQNSLGGGSVEDDPKEYNHQHREDQNLFSNVLHHRKLNHNQNHHHNKDIMTKSKQLRSISNDVHNGSARKLGMIKDVQNRTNIFKRHNNGQATVLRQANSHDMHCSSNYTFEDHDTNGKPDRVRIIRKEEMDSLRSSMRRSLSKTQISRINRDVTNRLYNQSQIKKTYLNKIRDKAKLQKEDQEQFECTHTPSINPISEAIVQNRSKGQPPFERLLEEGKRFEMKRQHTRNLLANKEMNGCSFHPQVNTISKHLASGKSCVALSRPKIVLNDCGKSGSKGDQNQFKPKINKVSEQIIRTKGSFDQRLKAFLQKKTDHLNRQAQQKLVREKIDPVSGQQLFQPKISARKPSKVHQNKDRHDSQDVCEYLFNLSKAPKSQPVQERSLRINQKSEQMVQQMIEKRLIWLFSELDSDNDGLISPSKLDIDRVQDDLLEVIKPVLFQMEQMDIQLNLVDFKRAIHNLHPSLNAHEKSILYNYKKKL